MEQYYIIENENKKGPFNLKELIALDLSENTFVWKKGLKDWTELKNLSEYKKTIPPPIPKTNISNESDNTENKNIEENVISDIIPDFDLRTELNVQGPEMSDHKNAGFGLRLVAFIIDFAFMFFLTSFFWALLQLPIPANSKSIFFGSFFIFKNPLGILFGWLFYAAFESSKFQATPGKAILGLKVTNENYGRIGFGQASGRFFGRILSGLILGVGYLMIGFTKKRQGLHDQMAHTLVLKENIVEVKRKPISWIIFASSFLLFIVTLFILVNTVSIETLDSFNISNFSNTYKADAQKIPFSYQGVSFEYPDNWKVEKVELQQDLAYLISCENPSAIISIIWINMDMEPKEMIQNTIENIRENPTCEYSNAKPIYTTVYNGYDAVKSDVDYVFLGENNYSRIISFNLNGKTFLITKETDNINKLDSEFKIIENSLRIE